MFLKNLKLTNFRNFAEINLDFAPITLFIGKNAQGKSNLLESIYFLAATRSHRVERDLQLIKQGESFCRVEGEVGEESEEGVGKSGRGAVTRLEVVMQLKSEDGLEGVEKRLKVNGVAKRMVDYLGNLVVVYFSPEDINLVSGSPALRRAYLDLTLSQIDREFKKALSRYLAVLVSRNKILKGIREGVARISELTFWTDQLTEFGQILSKKRAEFFRAVNEYALSSQNHLGRFQFEYRESPISEERLKEYLHREIEAAMTLIGPHRDDFIFELNGRDLNIFGSRGEQRTAVLELKLAELKFIDQTKHVQPVLLLDDIFSELDIEHQQHIISSIGDQQTIITAVETEPIPVKFRKNVRVLKVEGGLFFLEAGVEPGELIGDKDC